MKVFQQFLWKLSVFFLCTREKETDSGWAEYSAHSLWHRAAGFHAADDPSIPLAVVIQ